MRFNRGLGTLHIMQGVLGQTGTPATTTAPSYQTVWDALFSQCEAMIGEADCRRLLGYTPFVCPVPSESKLHEKWWFWFFVGVIGGVGLVKLAERGGWHAG